MISMKMLWQSIGFVCLFQSVDASELTLSEIKAHQFPQTFSHAEKRQNTGADAYSLGHVGLTQAYIDEIYYQLDTFDRVMRANNTKYSISSGTMLGAFRNGGLIPGDDDADVFVDYATVYQYPLNTNWFFPLNKCDATYYSSSWKKILADLAKEGFTPDCSDARVYKIHHKERAEAIEKATGLHMASLDVFPMIKQGDIYRYFDNAAYTFWGHLWHAMTIPTVDWEGKFEDIAFGPLTLKTIGKNAAIRHLKQVYGDDVLYVSYKIMDHAQRKSVSNVKTKLRLEEDYYYIAPSFTPGFQSFEFRGPLTDTREILINGKWVEINMSSLRNKIDKG